MSRIIVIDDEEYMGWIIQKAFPADQYEVKTATTAGEGLKMIEMDEPGLVILDLKMPDMDGMEVLARIKETRPEIPVIMITAHGSIDTAIQAMKTGAFDYITKPFDVDELILQSEKALDMARLKNEVKYLRNQVNARVLEIQLVSQNPLMREIEHTIHQIAPSQATVLITGESGTGKEIIARSIYQNSERNHKPFIAINCSAIPENLLESELFGYEKGAFTGASQRRMGRFELAQEGTLFLDEIGEMNVSMQVKILRVLQEKEFQRVGGNSTIKTDVRIIAATNRDLRKAIREGTFREDLFYRLHVIPIHLPPLRERKEDIPLLVEWFIHKFDTKRLLKGISPEVMEHLVRYTWPGNIRELENVMERMVLLSRDEYIGLGHLPREILHIQENSEEKFVLYFPPGGIQMEKVEQELICKALELSQGNQVQAARLLGLTRSALIYRMQKHGIQFDDLMEE